MLDNAKTNFLPLKEYKFIEFPNPIPSYHHLRVWRNRLEWNETNNLQEPSKICFISDIKNVPSDVYMQIINNGCSLVEDYIYHQKRYIIFKPKRKFDCPVYDLKSEGTVLFYCNAGYGDFFNCLRYIQLYPQAKFIAEVPSSLIRLAERTGLFYKVIERGENYKTDYYVTFKKLNEHHRHEGTSLPIIKVAPHPDVNGGIAFCFMGNRVKYTKRRTFDYTKLKNFQKYNLYNLQIEQNVDFAINLKIDDWYDTATIIQGCDLVITPPTSILHLAGIMAKPIVAVFKPEYENYEVAYFDKDGSKYYPLKKIYENQLEGYLQKYVEYNY